MCIINYIEKNYMNTEKIYNNFKFDKPFGSYEFANNSINYKSKILEFGCASGNFGDYLHSKRKCEIIGVDNSENQLEICKNKNVYNELYKIDLNNITNELDNYLHYFDTILLCDVIEHLVTPNNLLLKLGSFLKENGNIIIFCTKYYASIN